MCDACNEEWAVEQWGDAQPVVAWVQPLTLSQNERSESGETYDSCLEQDCS